MRLPDWFPGERARRAHDAAWAPELVRDAEGFTPYLRRAEAELVGRATEAGVRVATRAVHAGTGSDGEPTCWIEMTFAGLPFTVWIYDDQVDIGARRIEQWDGATPGDARRKVVAALDAAMSGPDAPAV